MEKRYNFYNLEPQFRTFLLAENISPITLKNYLSDFRHFAGWLTTNNKFAISRKENALGLPITSEDISNYRSYLYQNNLPQKTINRRLSTVRKFCSFCISQGWLTENPAKGITNLNNQIQYAAQSKKDHGIGSPETQLKDNKDKAFISLKSLKKITYWLGKKISSARTRPPSPASNFLPQYYIAFIIIMIFVASLGAGIYNQFFKKSEQTFAYPSSPIRAGRILSFQGRLTDALGNPINTATNITFKLYKDPTGGSALYTAGACSLTPDSTGVFNVLVGGSGYSPTPPQAVCGVEIDSSIFSENPNIYMGITVAGDSEMTPRQQIANVGYAINAETLQGLPPGSAISSVPFINKDGNMLIAASSPGIRSTYASSTFTLSSAQATTIQSAGAGDITLQATESGALRFRTGGNSDSYTRLFIDTAGNGGNVGIGTTGPDRKLDVLDASNPQLRLTQADGSKYTDFQTDSSGNLTVTPNGGLTNVTGGLDVSGTFKAGTSDAFQVDSSGNTTLSNQASLKLYEATVNGTNYVGLQAPSSLAADNSYTLPNAYPGAATGYYLTSNTSGAMSWSNSITASSLKWNTLTNPDGNLSLSMGTNTTGFNWATGTSTNNLLSLTTDNSANGTGALLNLQTGTSSTVLPLRVRAGSTDALMVNSSGVVGIGTTGPDRKLDVLDASNPQLRLTQADGSKYTDFQTDSSGNLTVTPNGGLANVTGSLAASSILQVGGSTPVTYSRFGTSTSGWGLSGASDVLISGKMEIDSQLYVDGTGSNYFVGSLGVGTNNLNNLLTVGSYNSAVSSSLKQGLLSVDNILLSQLEGGSYFGNIRLTENQFGLINYGNTWTAKDSSRYWSGVAMSSDGKIQTAVVSSGQIYVSTDYGNTWTAKDSSRGWFDIAMSSDGKIQTATVFGGQTYISYDYGNTWTAKDSSRDWRGIAMSSDGKIQTAVVSSGQIYVSTDYGNTWAAKDSSRGWFDIAMSSDGKIQTAVVDGGQVYVSYDYGNTWTAKDSSRTWRGVAMSSDGKIQTAFVTAAKIYVSTDYGNTWTAKDSNRYWYGVAMSSDGKIQTATANADQIYISTDYGNTWVAKDSSRDWMRIAMSSDGKVQTTVVSSGQIYVSFADSYLAGGSLGIGTQSPDAKLEISATSEQLRLTHTDNTYDARFTVDGSGNLNIDVTGTQVKLADNLEVAGTTGLTLSGVGGDITFANGSKIDNDTSNQINMNLGSSGTLLLTSTTTTNIANSAGDININATGGHIVLANNNTINIGGSGSSVNYNLIGDSTSSVPTIIDSDDDLFIEGNLAVAGVISGDTSDSLRLQAGGTTIGPSGNSSIFFLDSSGNTAGRYDTLGKFGNGRDGDIEISSTVNCTTTDISTSDGDSNADCIATSFTTTTIDNVISVGATTGFYPGDEVLLIQSNNARVGIWETKIIDRIYNGVLTFTEPLVGYYYGTSGPQVVRVPNYNNVTIKNGGMLIASGWDGTSGGIIFFRASGTVTVESGGIISVNGLGHQGGSNGSTGGAGGSSGGGNDCTGAATNNGADGTAGQDGSNGGGAGGGTGGTGGTNGGGGFVTAGYVARGGGGGGSGAGGGGGGYYSTGSNGNNGANGGNGGNAAANKGTAGTGGAGGSSYGDTTFSKIFFGSGGGGGGKGGGGGEGGCVGYAGSTATGGNGGAGRAGASGGNGGGITVIAARKIDGGGTIRANGQNGNNVSSSGINGAAGTRTGSAIGSGGGGGGGGGAGGGGAGGSIWTITNDNSFSGSINVTAGTGGTNSGSGGDGGGCAQFTSADTVSGGGGGGASGSGGTTNCDTNGSNAATSNNGNGGDGSNGRTLSTTIYNYGTLFAGSLNTTSADVAEYYPIGDPYIEAGDVVMIKPSEVTDITEPDGSKHTAETGAAIFKADKPYSNKLLGIISTDPGLILGSKDSKQVSKEKAVALNGRVPVKIDPDSDPITVGDFLTASEKPGYAKKATSSGVTIAKALESWNKDKDMIMVFVNLSWYDPLVYLTSTGDFDIRAADASSSSNIAYDGLIENDENINNNQNYNLFIKDQIVDRIGAFSEVIVAKIKSGFIETKNLITDNLVVKTKLISPIVETADLVATGTAKLNNIRTDEIKPIAENIILDLSETQSSFEPESSGSGKLAQIIIKGLQGKTVTTIDSSGNIATDGNIYAKTASFSGQIVAQSLSINTDATISGNLSADKILASEASISGTLTAKEINADNVNSLSSNIQDINTNINEIQQLIAGIQTQPLPDPNNYQNIADQQFNKVKMAELTVTGNSNFYNISISGSVLAGTTLIEDSSITSLASELKISALSAVNFFDGAVKIAKNGSMTVQGELIAQGGIRTDEIKPIVDDGYVSIDNLSVDKLAVTNKYLDATSSAVVIAAPDNFNQNGIFAPAINTASSSAGIALLPDNSNEVIVYNDNIKKDSLIYLTPTSQSTGRSLAVVDKVYNAEKPYFKVVINQPINIPVKFNWLIVN